MRAIGRLFAVLCLAVSTHGVRAEPAPEPSAEAVLATVPFEPGPPLAIVIDLAPKEHPRRMPLSLETGASSSVISPRFARTLGIARRGSARRETVLGDGILLEIDRRNSETGSSSGFEFGVVGGEFLSRYVVELDFARRRVRFFDPKRFEVPAAASGADEAVLAFTLVGWRPVLRTRIDGHELDLLVASGSPGALLLSGEFAERAGIRAAPPPAYRVKGHSGPIDLLIGDADLVELGTFRFERIPIVVAPKGLYNHGVAGDSLLGSELLAQFLVRIDYPRQRLWLKRRADAPTFFDPRTASQSY